VAVPRRVAALAEHLADAFVRPLPAEQAAPGAGHHDWHERNARAFGVSRRERPELPSCPGVVPHGGTQRRRERPGTRLEPRRRKACFSGSTTATGFTSPVPPRRRTASGGVRRRGTARRSASRARKGRKRQKPPAGSPISVRAEPYSSRAVHRIAAPALPIIEVRPMPTRGGRYLRSQASPDRRPRDRGSGRRRP